MLRAVQLQKELKLKNIQLDTLGYLTAHDRLSLSHLDLAEEWSRQCDIYEANLRETADMTVVSFQQGTYMQAVSFFELKQRLQNSIGRYLNDVEEIRCAMFRYGASPPALSDLATLASSEKDVKAQKARAAKQKEKHGDMVDKLYAFLRATEDMHALRDNRDTRVLNACLPDSLHEVTKTSSPRDVPPFFFLFLQRSSRERTQGECH